MSHTGRPQPYSVYHESGFGEKALIQKISLEISYFMDIGRTFYARLCLRRVPGGIVLSTSLPSEGPYPLLLTFPDFNHYDLHCRVLNVGQKDNGYTSD